MSQTIAHQSILGVIFAGGQSLRMQSNQPKWQLPLGHQPIIEHIINRFEPQVGELVINGQHPELASYPYKTVADVTDGFQGPLAGLLTGLTHAKQQGFDWVATCPCDSPFIPEDYVSHLAYAISTSHSTGAVIQHQGRLQPVFGLWSVQLYDSLKQTIETTNHRAFNTWVKLAQADAITLDYPNQLELTPFTNINTQQEWQAATKYWLSIQSNEHT